MRLQSVQFLRGLAALAVLLCHAKLFPLGAAGVDLFFVISGFIITKTAPGKTPAQFALDRAWRVFPLWWLLSLPWVALAFYLGMDTTAKSLTTLTLLPFDRIPYLRPGWSLIYEMLFYAAAWLVLLTGRWQLLVLLFVSCCTLNYWRPSVLAGYFGYPLILNFLLGVAIAQTPTLPKLWGAVTFFGGIGGLLIAPDFSASMIAMADDQSYARALWWGVPSAAILYGAVSLEGHWPLTSLGDASYSIYLIHLGPAVMLPAWAGVPVAILLGYAVHLWIEKPILRKKPKLRGQPDWDQSQGVAGVP